MAGSEHGPKVPSGYRVDGTARIYLARHGRTALNAAGSIRGHIDVPLDVVGQHQALLLGAALNRYWPRLVVSSPLRRAVETAEAITHSREMRSWVDERLTDRYYGGWAGVLVADVVARWGSLDAAPGVEAATEVRDRALAALTDIADSADGATAVVVSHDAVNRIVLVALDPGLGDPDDLPQETGCFNAIEYHKQHHGAIHWRVVTVNEVPTGEVEGPPPRVADLTTAPVLSNGNEAS